MVEGRSELVDIGSLRLHVVRWLARSVEDGAASSAGGTTDGAPVHVLVHGLASNARLWDGVAAALADAGRSVVAVDLRGHGRSDKPDDGYGMAQVADDLDALIERLGIVDPVVSGQSWGANVVVELAARHPGRAAAIACVDGGTIRLADRFADFDACWALLAPPRFPTDLTRAAVAERMARTHPDWPRSGIDGALACFEELPDGTIRPWLSRDRHRLVLQGLYEHDPAERLARISVPVLFMPADDGNPRTHLDKRTALDAAMAQLADGRVHWFSPADHDVHAQQPAEVAALLLALDEELHTTPTRTIPTRTVPTSTIPTSTIPTSTVDPTVPGGDR